MKYGVFGVAKHSLKHSFVSPLKKLYSQNQKWKKGIKFKLFSADHEFDIYHIRCLHLHLHEHLSKLRNLINKKWKKQQSIEQKLNLFVILLLIAKSAENVPENKKIGILGSAGHLN